MVNNRFKKDGKRISRVSVEKELSKTQFSALLQNGTYTTRKKTLSDPNSSTQLTVGELRKVNKIRHLYRVCHYFYFNKGWCYNLMKKDTRFGFERFCCQLPSDDENVVNKAILLDIMKK